MLPHFNEATVKGLKAEVDAAQQHLNDIKKQYNYTSVTTREQRERREDIRMYLQEARSDFTSVFTAGS